MAAPRQRLGGAAGRRAGAGRGGRRRLRRRRRRQALRAQLLGRELDQGAAHRPPAQPGAGQRARQRPHRDRRGGPAPQHHLRPRAPHGGGAGRRRAPRRAPPRGLTELGLQEGTLEKRVDGTVIYMTGREELEEMPLVRSDGVPTQHMRALAYWLADTGLDGTTSVQVCGQEWFAHVTCRRQLMAELVHTGEGNGFHPYHDIFHGMVAREREKIASSKKDALLIDHLVEWIDEQLEADPDRAGVRRGHPSPDRVASQVALGFFLLHSATKRVDFEPEKLLAAGKALGWDLVRARSRNETAPTRPRDGQMQSRAEAAADPDYHFTVVQAETYE